MRWVRGSLATITAVCGLVACGGEEQMTTAKVPMVRLSDVSSEEWQRLGQRRLFFGHQSVGGDILDGIADLLKQHPEIPLRVVESADPTRMSQPGLYHARIGENGAPHTKLSSFVRIASAAMSDSGTAMLKYCYVDVTAETDPIALFDTYRREIDSLRAANPGLRVVHFTLPLVTDYGNFFHWRAVIRGKVTPPRKLNFIRAAYNARLRATYAGREPIFDLAHLQSVGPDGAVQTVRYRRTEVPILVRDWTYDGGHLNEEGRRRIAEAFLVTLAKL